MTEQDLAAIFEAQANIRGMAEHGRPQSPKTQLHFFGQLQRAREIIEAHASTGRPFPGSVKSFAVYLQELAVPSWPGYTAVPGTAAGFQREAGRIVEAVLGSSPAVPPEQKHTLTANQVRTRMMNADTIKRALQDAIALPGTLQLQLITTNHATYFGRSDQRIPSLRDLGLNLPSIEQLQAIRGSMIQAQNLLPSSGPKLLAGSAAEAKELRALLAMAAAICQEAPCAATMSGLMNPSRDYIDSWRSMAVTFDDWARLLECCKPAELAPTLPAGGQEPAQISASTPAAAPNTIRHLNTQKSEQEQRRIFAALVEAGFIAGADAAGASMLQPFLNAFDPESREQGRIIWTGTPLRGGAAGKPSPTQALDFVALMAGGLSGITPAFARGAFPAIFQGLICSDDTRGEFTKKWNKSGGSEYHDRLAAIISPR